MPRISSLKTFLAPAFFSFCFFCLPSVHADTSAFVPNAVYANPKAATEARVSDLLGRLTQPEKLSLLALIGYGDSLKLNLPAVPRLGMPGVRTVDAPQGVKDGQASFFPLEVVMASTWDPALIRQVGAAIGQEARAKNRQIIYGPCVNTPRTPQDGRYFECFSEDPFVSSQMAAAYVEGMQSQGVAACVKHFVCNDQETGRHDINVVVGERALQEIYLPAFHAATTQAHVWALMPALGRVNGTFCAQSKPLMSDLLRDQWGWDGLAISDWGSVHSTADCLSAGTDVEMPQPQFYSAAALTTALQGGFLTQTQIDDSVRRVLRLMVRTGLLNPPVAVNPAVVNSPAHQALARKVAIEGITLLKNDRVLPLSSKLHSIAVIGPNAEDTQLGGRWSADVSPFYRVSVLDGIKTRAGRGVAVTYAQGCPRTGPGTPGELTKAAALASSADVAIVVVGTDNNYEGEELDIPNLFLPGDQEKLIQAVSAANKHTVVVLNCGTPVLTQHWLSGVSGLLETWYAGEEAGNAAAAILFGDVNPSGKLTGTWATEREDYSDWGNYPGANNFVRYMEGIYVGYRHFDKEHLAPLFPFGYGLSYTTFAYSHLQVQSNVKIGMPTVAYVTVQNTGKRAGDEIIQLYVRPLNPRADRPLRELKAFVRVPLASGQKKTVTLTLDPNALAYWDTSTHAWRTDPGAYALDIGASSRDIRLTRTLHLTSTRPAGYTQGEATKHV